MREGYRSPRRFATEMPEEYSARAWTSPVLWRFVRDYQMEDGRIMNRQLLRSPAPGLPGKFFRLEN